AGVSCIDACGAGPFASLRTQRALVPAHVHEFSRMRGMRIMAAEKAGQNGGNGAGDADMRFNSKTLYDGNSRAGARAMMKSIGFSDEDLQKPIIGIANTWIETMPCNFGLRKLAEEVKKGVRAAGGTPM